MPRSAPYGAFNFLVKIGTDDFGGFSDVSGLSTELKVAEYREGNDPENHVTKVPGTHTVGDVTLKRGIVNSQQMWGWIRDSRSATGSRGMLAKRDVVITMLDEAGTAVQSWKLFGVVPLKYSGPNFAAKGGTDVAMEEIVLSAEGLDLLEAPSA
jgi:phage tail-like protein